jgi:hypothetical protein|tara:strand:+ start:6221 stop:7699 length:1479 start_codon:yes stop_codon:yes gene_type:complete
LNVEASKKKSERLKNVLLQKLLSKYGKGNKMIITALVDQFLIEKGQIGPDDLAQLEKEVVMALEAKKVAISGSSSNKLAAAGATVMGNGNSDPNNADMSGAVDDAGRNAPYKSSAPPASGSEWSVIQAYQILQGEEKEKEEKQIAMRKKADFRAALDKHMEEARIYKQQHTDAADQEYFAHVKQDIQNFHSEEKSKLEKIHEKAKVQLRIQNEQIAEKARMRAIELHHEREVEEQMLADARQKIEDEKNKMNRLRERAKENQERVNRENEENQRLRDIARQRDAEEDKRLQAEYAAKLDAEDAARESAFAKRMEKMAAFSQKSAEEGAGFKAKQQELETERILLKNQAEKEARDKAAEERKAREKKMRLQRMLAENEKILTRKAREAEEARAKDLNYANAAIADVEKYKREEQAKVDKVKANYAVYRKVLDEQMKTRAPAADPTSAAFIGREAQLNGSLYQRAIQDPAVLKRIEPKAPKEKVNAGPRIATHK